MNPFTTRGSPHAYRMEEITREQMMEHDPFAGHGERFPFPVGTSSMRAIEMIAERFGSCGWVMWGTHAWIDTRTVEKRSDDPGHQARAEDMRNGYARAECLDYLNLH